MSKIKIKVRQDVSQVFNVLIPKDKWQNYFDLLDRDGHPNRKELLGLILVFAQHLENLEDLIEDLYFQQGLVADSQVPPPTTSQDDFALRTPISIAADLEKLMTPNTKRFYLSERDWRIMEQNVSQEMAKNNPEFGFGKETDPRDFKEKTCLYYKGLPIFRK